ncbi:MAG: hypothetical protein WC408_01700, partial [Candidatus Micrarchaeia archaeon]
MVVERKSGPSDSFFHRKPRVSVNTVVKGSDSVILTGAKKAAAPQEKKEWSKPKQSTFADFGLDALKSDGVQQELPGTGVATSVTAVKGKLTAESRILNNHNQRVFTLHSRIQNSQPLSPTEVKEYNTLLGVRKFILEKKLRGPAALGAIGLVNEHMRKENFDPVFVN